MTTPFEESVTRDSVKSGVPFTGNPRDIESEGTVQIGSKARDASVDPSPEDYVVPTNAGDPTIEGDPHGPHVRAITVDSPEWVAYVARDRREHPERYAGTDPTTVPGSSFNINTPVDER